jgi:hypothetical protein
MPALAPVIAMTWSSICMVASSDGVDGFREPAIRPVHVVARPSRCFCSNS